MNKTILITGANKGIGFETARQLGRLGHHVILSARNENRLYEAVTLLKRENLDVEGLLLDVRDEHSINKAANTCISQNTKIDVLINNAGILIEGDSCILTDDITLYTNTILTNSTGPLRVIKAFMGLIQPNGRIINVSSGGGTMSESSYSGFAPAYCLSKTLLNGITRLLAADLAPQNITVNAVCPGWVRTDMGGLGADRSAEKGAETLVWLATEADPTFTGQLFRDKLPTPW